MDYEELLQKHRAVLKENEKLKFEIGKLKSQLQFSKAQSGSEDISFKVTVPIIKEVEENTFQLDNMAAPEEKIKLFMSLFKGREDVYAKRWENHKKGTTGYSPVCLNEWKPDLCNKPKANCYNCKNKDYAALDESIVSDHLRGHNNFVVGVYPLCLDEACYFLAIDFDGEEWQKDISMLRDVCSELSVPLAVERSRSGNGAHAWFFFAEPIPAVLARKFGSALLTNAMTKRHEIKFKSYDRLFPNQDTMPKGGLGNLIALPLQKAARNNGNSEFIDENGRSYDDQWAYLSSMCRISENEIEQFTTKLCQGSELGELRKNEEEHKPWCTNKRELKRSDFPTSIEIIKADMMYVLKNDISQRALNHLKRLAAFKNPEFYRAQAMRLPVRKISRIISCSDESDEYLCLPRGCEADIIEIAKEIGFEVDFIDKANQGKRINVEFNGTLRDDQPLAVNKLLQHNNGVLCGTTAFGKTVAAIKIIADLKVNTLIIVDKVNLVSQWTKRISEFLIINEKLPDIETVKRRGRKKPRSIIGQLGGGKNSLNGIIDIAVMQSLNRMGEIKDCVKNYGLVIVDECHHVSAFSFEEILKKVN
ncbi:MAG: DEAD/DEAH box helicase family protein, partial [Firmicutes bacterium]|nr:DEAD/DEAH box helicase family protein [Bacillota bacterium]